MKATALKSTAFLVALLTPAALLAQERAVPRDSLRISIPGCAKGSAFVVGISPEQERTSTEVATGRRFRLAGKKDVLNEIKKREGTMVEITGLIRKSDLGSGGGITTGGGRVRIGGGPPVAATADPARTPASGNAILDVEGWRPLAESCPTR